MAQRTPAFLRDTLITAATLAGDVHRRVYSKGSFVLENKFDGNGASDVVTKADIESEKALRSFFAQHLPEYTVYGEEFGGVHDGNTKIIVLDPLDGTLSFKQGLPCFGPIIGVYDNGKNIAGVTYNVMKDIMYVGTESGFERMSVRDTAVIDARYNALIDANDDTIKDTICVGGNIPIPQYKEVLKARIPREFPGHPVRFRVQDVINKDRVFDGSWTAYFHVALAWHDIAAAPLFGKLTGCYVTDHNGVPYDSLNADEILRKYDLGTKEQIYSYPVIIAKPEAHAKMMNVVAEFKDELDKVKSPR